MNTQCHTDRSDIIDCKVAWRTPAALKSSEQSIFPNFPATLIDFNLARVIPVYAALLVILRALVN